VQAKLLLLVLVSVTYFGIVFTLSTLWTSQALTRLPEQTWSLEREAFARVVATELSSSFFSFSEQALGAVYPSDLARTAQAVLANAVHAEDAESGLMYGSAWMGTPGMIARSATLDAIMFDDVCARYYAQDAVCPVIMRGALTHGAHNALMEYLRAAVDLANFNLANPPNSTADSFARALHPRLVELQTMVDQYLEPLLDKVTLQLRDDELAAARQGSSNAQIALAIFCVAAALSYAFVYEPLVTRLDADLKRSRGMLLMVPYNLIVNSQAFRTLLNAGEH
jgi:hypothetical protein